MYFYGSVGKKPPKLATSVLSSRSQMAAFINFYGALQKSGSLYFHHILKETMKPLVTSPARGTACSITLKMDV